MSHNGKPVVLIADKLAQSTIDALGDQVEVRWVDGPNRPELIDASESAPIRRARTGLCTVVIAVLAGALTLGALSPVRVHCAIRRRMWRAVSCSC